jgi:hypothetical protein
MADSTQIPPAHTSSQSPDTLPLRKYTRDQLVNYIFRQLGGPVWNIELTRQQALDAVQDALNLYSIWVPCIRVGNITLVKGQFRYLEDQDVGQCIVNVSFVEPNPVPTEMFYGNLINPAPLFRVGMDEYDMFLRWRKTWQRVTSVKPDWFYDEVAHALYIHNPIERYQAGIFIYADWQQTTDLDAIGSQWVKEYALEQSRFTYGEILAKFSGAIPAPVKDLQLDNQKRDKAEKRLDKLRERLQGMQRLTPISFEES